MTLRRSRGGRAPKEESRHILKRDLKPISDYSTKARLGGSIPVYQVAAYLTTKSRERRENQWWKTETAPRLNSLD